VFASSHLGVCLNTGFIHVPTNLLFDISKLDLDQVTIAPEDVPKYNPHSGDMRHLDHVIWLDRETSSGLGVKQVRDDEFWVPGHIPGRPLLPGVIMIEAAAQLSSVLYKWRSDMNADRFLGFTRCDDVIFRGQVVPGDTLYLLVQEKKFGERRFSCDAQGVVNGTLVFEAKITGMRI
jgi:3-hydroxyacyl-[acyl-carrier-protein] dehydratase